MTPHDRRQARLQLREIVVLGPIGFVKANVGKRSGQSIAGMLGYLYEEVERLKRAKPEEATL